MQRKLRTFGVVVLGALAAGCANPAGTDPGDGPRRQRGLMGSGSWVEIPADTTAEPAQGARNGNGNGGCGEGTGMLGSGHRQIQPCPGNDPKTVGN